MFNIFSSSSNIETHDLELKSLNHYSFNRIYISTQRYILGFCILFLIVLNLPWTQNIEGNGTVTALKPSSRPQQINAVIPGRIEKWYVNEGDLVIKGDTIVYISEIKDKYFDPQLIERTRDQIGAKENKVKSYYEKANRLDNQIDALLETSILKLEQTRNKIIQAELQLVSDSLALTAAESDFNIAEIQLARTDTLFNEGLKSRTELENKRQSMQMKKAKYIESQNKLLSSRNKLINSQIELNSIENQYKDKLAKAESEKFSTLSLMYQAETEVTKLQNEVMNYTVRSNYNYITAPQTGYITQAIRVGIGETIKEGEAIVTIMPTDYLLATQLFFDPIDLPLIKKGEEVRLIFDGWPAVIFSGWPGTSVGTYVGRVNAIDNFTSTNGKFRVLVEPDTTETKWPELLRLNGGAKGYLLLNDVPIWYELWRQFNGFPPDFYETFTLPSALGGDKKK